MVQRFQRTGRHAAVAGSPGAIHTGSNRSAGCPGLACVSLLLTLVLGHVSLCVSLIFTPGLGCVPSLLGTAQGQGLPTSLGQDQHILS